METNLLAIILASGADERLSPLTVNRAKPAVPFGGKYRVIDFTLSNCLHSGLRKILVMTRDNSHSLNKHLRDGWSVFNPELGEYVTPVPAQMRVGSDWYQGSANAMYQNRYLIDRSNAEWTLILSGDHIYRMDYASMLDAHQTSGADITVACTRTSIEDSRDHLQLAVDANKTVNRAELNPTTPIPSDEDPEQCLVSMDIYLLSKQLLSEILEQNEKIEHAHVDLGKSLLPELLQTKKVNAYFFGEKQGQVSVDHYWRDVSTLDALYQANMDLLQAEPPMDLYQEDWPIRSYQSQTPPARAVPGRSGTEGVFINSILAGGAVIAGGNVDHSILFEQVRIGDKSLITNSVLFADVRVGDKVRLNNCMIDKHVVIPNGESIGMNLDRDRERFSVTDGGIVVIPKNYRF